jgi:hypothetical protein
MSKQSDFREWRYEAESIAHTAAMIRSRYAEFAPYRRHVYVYRTFGHLGVFTAIRHRRSDNA